MARAGGGTVSELRLSGCVWESFGESADAQVRGAGRARPARLRGRVILVVPGCSWRPRCGAGRRVVSGLWRYGRKMSEAALSTPRT